MIYELYMEEKLPKGWNKRIKDHCEDRDTEVKRHVYKSPTFQSWYSMVRRCYLKHNNNPNSQSSIYYQSLGIKVCRRWIEGDGNKLGFECFLEDMGNRPEDMTLDRIDPTLQYTPDNCRWADAKTQATNKRKRHADLVSQGRMEVLRHAR